MGGNEPSFVTGTYTWVRHVRMVIGLFLRCGKGGVGHILQSGMGDLMRLILTEACLLAHGLVLLRDEM